MEVPISRRVLISRNPVGAVMMIIRVVSIVLLRAVAAVPPSLQEEVPVRPEVSVPPVPVVEVVVQAVEDKGVLTF